jgi:hypothetical protein
MALLGKSIKWVFALILLGVIASCYLRKHGRTKWTKDKKIQEKEVIR